MSGFEIRIRDISGLPQELEPINEIIGRIKEGTYIFTTTACSNSFSVGYIEIPSTPTYILDVYGKARITENTLIEGKLDVYKYTVLNTSLQVKGETILNDNLTVIGNTSIGSNLFVGGNLLFNNNISLMGRSFMNQTADVVGNTSIGSDLYVNGSSQFQGNVSVFGKSFLDKSLDVVGNASIGSDLYVNGSSQFQGNFSVFGKSFLDKSLDVVGNTSIGSDLYVNGSSQFQGNVSVFGKSFLDKSLDVVGNASVGTDMYVNGSSRFQGNISVYGKSFLDKSLDVVGNASVGTDMYVNGSSRFQGNVSVYGKSYLDQTLDVVGNTYLSNVSINGNATINNLYVNGEYIVYGSTTLGSNVAILNELRIKSGGTFVIESASTNIIELQREVQITSELNISNNGTGPAIRVSQHNPSFADIMLLEASGLDVFSVGGLGDTQIGGKLRLGHTVMTPYEENNIGVAYPFNSYVLDVSGSGYIHENMTVYNNMSVNGQTYMNGLVTLKNDLTSYSDKRIKKNIQPLEYCLDKITNIHGYTFQRIDLDTSKTFIGMIAQEIEIPFPELVTELDGIKTVNYPAFTSVLLECIQELKKKIVLLENKILR